MIIFTRWHYAGNLHDQRHNHRTWSEIDISIRKLLPKAYKTMSLLEMLLLTEFSVLFFGLRACGVKRNFPTAE